MLPVNITQNDQGSPTANLQGSGDSQTPLLVKEAPESPEFWKEFLDELRSRYGIIFDQWESDFRDGRSN
jgi:hypothetical protein